MIVLSLLGTGNYSETTYSWEGRKKTAKYMQEALAGWFKDAKTLVCVTEEARDAHEKSLVKLIPNLGFIDIPMGKEEAEFYAIFEKVNAEIPPESELVLDITHGFRSLPILVLLTVAFLRVAKKVRVKHVLYGAFDARQSNQTPVFDLMPFLTMLDWASATERFLEIGDTSKFHQLTVRDNIPHSLKRGVEELENLSYAVAANRTFLVGYLASSASCIDQEVEHWSKEFGPIKLLLPKIKEVLSDLSTEKGMQLEGQLQQLFKQIIWYFKHGYYEKAIGLAREWFITFVQYKCVECGGIKKDEILAMNDEVRSRWDGAIGRIGSNLMNNKEKLEQQVRGVFGERFEFTGEWKGLFDVWQELKDVRNDLLHFGFRSEPKKPVEVESAVRKCLTDLRDKVREMGLELPEVP